jgi:hypothetical protein
MFWIGVILFVIGASIIFVITDCDLGVVAGTFLVAIGTIIFINEGHPTAMDVYQGKTTLKVTYKDNVPVDSVVVFKDNEK